ncbi:hypothetical protein D3C78_1408050 [compost metagenome]
MVVGVVFAVSSLEVINEVIPPAIHHVFLKQLLSTRVSHEPPLLFRTCLLELANPRHRADLVLVEQMTDLTFQCVHLAFQLIEVERLEPRYRSLVHVTVGQTK